MSTDPIRYQLGFGNEFESEAEPGALPVGQNSPQVPAYGLVSELVSGTTFAAARSLNRRSYLFRIRPSVVHGAFEELPANNFASPPFSLAPNPNQMRWNPFGIGAESHDFIDGLLTICGNGDMNLQVGLAIHVYTCNASMRQRGVFQRRRRIFADSPTWPIAPGHRDGRFRMWTGENWL